MEFLRNVMLEQAKNIDNEILNLIKEYLKDDNIDYSYFSVRFERIIQGNDVTIRDTLLQCDILKISQKIDLISNRLSCELYKLF